MCTPRPWIYSSISISMSIIIIAQVLHCNNPKCGLNLSLAFCYCDDGAKIGIEIIRHRRTCLWNKSAIVCSL